MKKFFLLITLLISANVVAQISSVTSSTVIEAAKINQLIDKINELEQKIVPVGSVIVMAGNCPSGYRLANGDSLARADFSQLFSAIGTAHGFASATHFNIPDYRGRFLRGVDDGSKDPNAATRTAMNIGGNTGMNVGSIQDDAIQGHVHAINSDTNQGFGGAGPYGAGDTAVPYRGTHETTRSSAVTGPINDGTNGTPKISSETRPKNAYVNYCIKF